MFKIVNEVDFGKGKGKGKTLTAFELVNSILQDRQNAAIQYNEICRRFWAETANSNELVELLALDSGEFDEKSYEQLVVDMQRFHGRNKDMEESEYIEYLSHMFDESFCSQL